MVDTFRIPPLLLAVLGITLACACLGSDPDREKPGSKVIHPAEAAIMIKEMRDDPGFVIIDVRTADEFARGTSRARSTSTRRPSSNTSKASTRTEPT